MPTANNVELGTLTHTTQHTEHNDVTIMGSPWAVGHVMLEAGRLYMASTNQTTNPRELATQHMPTTVTAVPQMKLAKGLPTEVLNTE